MPNSLDSFLTRIGDVTIERVNPRGLRPAEQAPPGAQPDVQLSSVHNEIEPSSCEDSSGEMSDADVSPEKNQRPCDDDDMDLDETIDSQIGVRLDSQPPVHRDEDDEEVEEEDDDIEAVDILENLPLEGAPIEGQEVTEADLLGKSIEKELEEAESDDTELDKSEPGSEDGETSGKRQREGEGGDSATKKQKVEECSDEAVECETKQVDKKTANMRRNIREVMDETQLDEATLAAQRQEMERLRRVQEQQKMLREVQKQFMVNRQGNKSQQRAVSLFQNKQAFSGTTISPSVPLSAHASSSSMSAAMQARSPSTVLTKINAGSGSGSITQIHSQAPSSGQFPGRPLQDVSQRWQRGRAPPLQSTQTSISRVPSNIAGGSANMLQQRIRMMTPSVSISPVVPKKEPRRRVEMFSESEASDLEADEELREKQVQTMRKLSSGSKPPKSPKGKELVTISSSSESSDDDCIVLSDPSDNEESDNEDDPSNSGMHTNDRYNAPDEHGRVLVNVGHPESEPDVFLAPQVARIIKPHQIGGIRFLYDNIVESIERYKTSSGFGCILAHSMGLGKTLQVASFCDIFFRCTSAKTVLCIMPINTLQNWLAEFNMWLPYEDPNAPKKIEVVDVKQEPGCADIKTEVKQENQTDGAVQNIEDPTMSQQGYPTAFENGAGVNYSNSFGQSYQVNYPDIRQTAMYQNYGSSMEKKEDLIKKEPRSDSDETVKETKSPTPYSVDAPAHLETRPRHFHLHILNDSHKSMAARARVIKAWQREGGVLMIGYELYRQLSLKKPTKSKRRRGGQKEAVDLEEEDKNKGLLDEMHGALVSPGPDLVICDEGHRIKNSHASISLALKQMRTKRRIVLTGYPLQNNLLEYWCMVDFVRPNYLGTKSEFCNMFERPIQNGQCIDSTPQDIRLMRYRAHVLHALLEGFVQRRSHTVLQLSLPRKEEYILLVRMTPFQRKLYDTFMNQVVKTRAVPNPLKAFAVCCKIWNHPDILYHFLRKRQTNEEDDLDLEETIKEKPAAPGVKRAKPRQPRGEGKKGKKGERKSKPAASVQPTSAGSKPNQEAAAEPESGPNKGKRFQGNFPGPAQNAPGFNSNQSGQQYPTTPAPPTQEYQNYYPEGSTEYNNYYNDGQSFQQYPANSNYSSGQIYSGQNQEYGASDTQTQGQNYEQFPRQGYGSYPDRSSGNYNQNMTQGQNYPPGFQNQMPVQDYQHNTNYPVQQSFSNSNQQNQSLGFGGNSSSQSANQNTPYINAQRNQNQSHNFQGNQQNQTLPMANYPANQSGPRQQLYAQGQSGSMRGYNAGAAGQNVPNAGYSTGVSGQNQQSYNQNQQQIYPEQSGSNANQNYPIGHSNTRYPSGTNQSSGQPIYSAGNSSQSEHAYEQNQNYPAGTSQNQNYQTTEPVQRTQFKTEDDQYWQRNYQQPYGDQKYGEGYFHGDANATSGQRFQGNYYPAQNYQSSSFDYANAAPPREDASKIREENKLVPGAAKESSAQAQKMSMDFAPGEGAGRVPLPGSRPEKVEGIKEEEDKESREKEKEEKSDEEIVQKEEEKDLKSSPACKEDPGIPYDWATELMKGYVPGLIDASAKMTLFFCILEEAIMLGDRVLAFSQSLFTLNLIEDFLARNDLKYPDSRTESWTKNVNYYRLDGSTSALEREKLINEFNANPKIHLFLVSTRAGSLGINLVGANRAIVFDASWNPCHDTQAVCRVYRYGQQKQCYVYRLVTDNCLERKIYDRQISKQGMADRVVDQCNPDAHLSLKEATTLSWDWEEDSQVQDFSQVKDTYPDPVMHKVLKQHSSLLTKQPFHHESLLVDRKDKKLSQAEKRLARRGYELEKMAANCSRPSYNYVPGNTATRGGLQIRAIRGGAGGPVDAGPAPKPVASVRPMQQRGGAEGLAARGMAGSRWIPAEVWQRQGMSAQEMTLPLDVVIPTNSPDKGSIVLKAGQRVMVLKSPKGIYMQLESGKIIAIRTALKLNQQKRDEEARAEPAKKDAETPPKSAVDAIQANRHLPASSFSSPGFSSSSSPRSSKLPPPVAPQPEVGFPLRNNSAISIIPKTASSSSSSSGQRPLARPFEKEPVRRQRPVATAAAKPYSSQVNITNQVSLSRLPRVKQEPQADQRSPSGGENSNSSDGGQVRIDQRVEEVRLEDVVAEVAPHSEYEGAPPARAPARRPPVREDASISARMYSPAQPTPETTQLSNAAPPTQEKEKEVVPVEDVIIEDRQVALQASQRTSDNRNVEQRAPPTDTQKSTQSDSAAASREFQPEEHAQSYPYGQFPRYYDYGDPRSRTMSNPYGSYYPPPPTSNNRVSNDPAKAPTEQQNLPKTPEDTTGIPTAKPSVYQQNTEAVAVVAPPQKQSEIPHDNKQRLDDTTASSMPNVPRDDPNNAYGHPSGTHYPGPYPPAPYDPYAQHYPHAPGSSTGYPPAGTPGYPAYGGPSYNADYSRMYSAFHGPPPPAPDPYIHHRGYAPPTSHPPNYYPPFPPPPPPYPNYSYLPPYPNPGVPAEPQPPAQ